MKVGIVTVIGALATLLLLVGVASANGGGQTSEKLENAGWSCVDVGVGQHCFPPEVGQSSATVKLMVFSPDGQEFFGTELLIHEDLYEGQPCPQDGGGMYEPVPDTPYVACHHFER